METAIRLEERIGSHLDNGNIIGEIESPSRRKFLKKLGIGLIGLAGYKIFGGSEANAQSIYDNMGYLRQHLPPGILNCRDRAIRILYADQVEGLFTRDFGEIDNRMNGKVEGYFDSVVVEHKSKRIEPALYLLREQINYKYRSGRGITVRLPEVRDVPQILHFDRGIRKFYVSYVYRRNDPYILPQFSVGSEQTKRDTESNFIHSIAYAAYNDTETAEAKAKEYLESDMEGKREVVMDMKKQFEKMGNGDRNSEEPRNPYNRKLAASWSSYWLVGSYSQSGTQDEMGLLINRQIEIPLREDVGFRIRGPIHYKY